MLAQDHDVSDFLFHRNNSSLLLGVCCLQIVGIQLDMLAKMGVFITAEIKIKHHILIGRTIDGKDHKLTFFRIIYN